MVQAFKSWIALSLGQSSTCQPSFQPSWMSAITTNNKNDYHCSAIQDRNLQWKPNTTKFGSIFNLNMLWTILDASNYDKSENMKHES